MDCYLECDVYLHCCGHDGMCPMKLHCCHLHVLYIYKLAKKFSQVQFLLEMHPQSYFIKQENVFITAIYMYMYMCTILYL